MKFKLSAHKLMTFTGGIFFGVVHFLKLIMCILLVEHMVLNVVKNVKFGFSMKNCKRKVVSELIFNTGNISKSSI